MTSQPITTTSTLAVTSDVPRLTAHQIKTLKRLVDTSPAPLPHTAPNTITSLLKRELMERVPTSPHALQAYQLTDYGRALLEYLAT